MLWAQRAGSVRRGQEFVEDLTIVAASTAPAQVLDAIAQAFAEQSPSRRDDERLLLVASGHDIEICCPRAGLAETRLLFRTGAEPHIAELQRRATERGWQLTPDGLATTSDGRWLASTESEIYAALDLPFVPPEIRNGDDEFVAARAARLPSLVELGDIRGDLHMHSEWSDGRDPIEAMVQTAIALGYDYIAITDHSPRSAAVRNLSIDSVGRQADEVARLREAYPQLAILHGCEADILESGALDFTDAQLERFDIVLASLHDQCGHGSEQLLDRAVTALRHPLVNALTHPTNRVFPTRAGYELDYDRLFEVAAETGTPMEIDGAPTHLDLDASLARRAIQHGATVIISSDAHRTDALSRNLQLGLLTARRGWVEPRSVLNTRPLTRVQAAIAAKRAGRTP